MNSPEPTRTRDLVEAALAGPLRLLPNRIERFYRGGYAIDELLGVPEPRDDNFSEEWVGNTTHPAGLPGDAGLARTALLDGSVATIESLIESHPERMLGARHLERYGSSPALLLKYLDCGTHIPVHCHPTREFARAHLGSDFGKNEAWYVLGARRIHGEPAKVWVGWRKAMDRDRLADLVARQDVPAMRAAMHEIEVAVGDVLFVPGGMAHSLGTGVFAMEPQEPTDFGVMAEHSSYDLDVHTATNGLGWDLALECFDLSVLDEEELDRRVRCAPRPGPEQPGGQATGLVSEEAAGFFRLGELAVRGSFTVEDAESYTIACVREGAGRLRGPWGEQFLRRGEAYFVPASVGALEAVADSRDPLRLVLARPPR